MKKMIVSFSLLLSGTLATFANEPAYPSQYVLNEFKKEFAAAENVVWSKQDDFDRATFILAGKIVVAYFNSTGQLEGAVRNIFFDQLPLAVMTAIDKRFEKAEIIDVREITNGDGTSYSVSLEAKNKKYRVRVTTAGGVEEVKKIPK